MDEDVETVRFQNTGWLAPVEKVGDLPRRTVANGALCYVKGQDEVYTFMNGVWVMGAHRAEGA